MVRHSHQDALDDASYERLVQATDQLDEPFQTECLAILVFAGRLGLRAGEIAHLDRSWLNTERNVIEIPSHDPCRDGMDGHVCGYCRKRARETVEATGIPLEKALEMRWEPKTAKGARAVPYDFDPFVQIVVEEFFEQYQRWPRSRVSLNRRVDRLKAASGYEGRLYPHALRSTAATRLAYKGVPAAALQAMFGWHDISVAQKYIRLSGQATSKALNEAFGD